VSEKQEVSLKVKYYVPPQASCPEIFLLPDNINGMAVSSMSLEGLDTIGKQRQFQWEDEKRQLFSVRPLSVEAHRRYVGENHIQVMAHKRHAGGNYAEIVGHRRHAGENRAHRVIANHLDESQTNETGLHSQQLLSHESPGTLLVNGQSPERLEVHGSKNHFTFEASNGKLQQPSELKHAANKATRVQDDSHPAVIVCHPSDSNSSTNNQSNPDLYKQSYSSELIKEEAPERDPYSTSTYNAQQSKSPVMNYLRTESQWETTSISSDGSDVPVIHPLESIDNSQLDEKRLQAVTAQFEAALFGDSSSSQNPKEAGSFKGVSSSGQGSEPAQKQAADRTSNQPLSRRQNKDTDDGTNSQPLLQEEKVFNNQTGEGTDGDTSTGKTETFNPERTVAGTLNEHEMGPQEIVAVEPGSDGNGELYHDSKTAVSTKQRADVNNESHHDSKAKFSKTKPKGNFKGTTASNTRDIVIDQSVKQRNPNSKRELGRFNIRPSKTTGVSSLSNHISSASSDKNHDDQQPVESPTQQSKETRKKFNRSHQQSPQQGRLVDDRSQSTREPVAVKKSSECDGLSEEDQLLAELKALQQSRIDLTQNHTRLVNEAKALQVKSQRHRQETEGSWKKKYLSEKKRTRHLEQQCGKLRQQLHLVLAQNRVDKQAAKGCEILIRFYRYMSS
jgi:hypothetical protein